METAHLIYKNKEYELPVVGGTENEIGIDIAKLRKETGMITLDSGYANTGSWLSSITFIDGEKGILRYRGYPIEELAQAARFVEICYLLVYGHLPTQEELDDFRHQLSHTA